MKPIIALLLASLICGCSFNLYQESIEIKPRIFDVVSVQFKEHLTIDLKDRNSDRIYKDYKIPDKCQELVQVGDILILDSITKVRNGITTYSVSSPVEVSSSCFGKI